LLGIANGSNDIITGILAALLTEEEDEIEQQGIHLAVGGLVGSSLFSTTIVLGVIIFTTKDNLLKISPGQLIKDSAFLLATAVLILPFVTTQKITLGIAILFLVLYAMYFLLRIYKEKRYLIVSFIMKGSNLMFLSQNAEQEAIKILQQNKDHDIFKKIEGDTIVAIDRNAVIDQDEYCFLCF